MRMIVGGVETAAEEELVVQNPFDDSVVGRVAVAGPGDVEKALAASVAGASSMESTSRRERVEVLRSAAGILRSRAAELAVLLAGEVGKTVREARGEVARAVETFSIAAGEAERLAGEVVPFDSAPTGDGRFGFTLRVPLGVVVAVTPFNFPLNLAAHKVAPAIAAGNAVILKPPSATPMSGIELGRILLEAGLPPEAISVLPGPGATVGDALVSDERPRMVTFTGSAEVGRRILARAGLKRTAMELGSNSALIVTDCSRLEEAAERAVRGACALAGQVCISVQRILVHENVVGRFVEAAAEVASSLRVGDQLLETTDVGPMISAKEARRADEWIEEAVSAGAREVVRGKLRGATLGPTILADVPEETRVWREEAFAPVASVRTFDRFEDAVDTVNRSRYGLQAGVYTDDLEEALTAAHEIRCGGVMVNDVPTFRVDLMPYGGEKDSGLGREGPRYAVREMSETRVVGIRRSSER